MSAILITGGTGSFGQHAAKLLLEEREQVDVTSLGSGHQVVDGEDPRWERIIVFSRDELKQHEMREAGLTDPRLRYFIGDVRDRQRLTRAMRGVSHVIHAAALKQVPACEYNPIEALRTNVDGTANVIEAALDSRVGRVIMVGTDKAVDAVNTYGKSKALAEALVVDAWRYGGETTKFAATRYGNVLGSRGSVLPLFQAQHAAGRPLTVTDAGMTRFVLTLDQGVRFVLARLGDMRGGEVFVPKLPAVMVDTIACAVSWPAEPVLVEVGVRPGEKQHEILVSRHELVEDRGEYLVVGSGEWRDHREMSSFHVPRLNVAAFRELAGLVVGSADNAKEPAPAVTAARA